MLSGEATVKRNSHSLAGMGAGALASLLAFASATTGAWAQDAADPARSGGELPDIVVTAEFRESRVQDTPLAIT